MNVFEADVFGGGAVPPGLLGEALFSFDWSTQFPFYFSLALYWVYYNLLLINFT